MKVITPDCPYCNKFSTVEVDEKAYRKWQRGAFIQTAFPTLSPNERELLITGTHPECWDKMFGDEE